MAWTAGETRIFVFPRKKNAFPAETAKHDTGCLASA
jgi:hypothetical protein